MGPLYTSLSELYRRSRKLNGTRLRNSTAPGPRQHTTVWHSTTAQPHARTHKRRAELGENYSCKKFFRRAEFFAAAAAPFDCGWRRRLRGLPIGPIIVILQAININQIIAADFKKLKL
jgi:hypothetical protein